MPASHTFDRSNIPSLLEKSKDFDKDERYMAVSDLTGVLSSFEANQGASLDASLERRVCAAVLQRLDDTSNDVQSVAVKCLGVLLTRVSDDSAGTICDKLCAMVIQGKEELRDVYGIGLKKLIGSVGESSGGRVAERLVKRLLGGVQQDNEVGVKTECLDCLDCLLLRFRGKPEMVPYHSQIMSTALTQLASKSPSCTPATQKKSTVVIATLAVVVSDDLLFRLVQSLLRQITEGKDDANANTLVKAVCKISTTVGYRLGKQLPQILPIFLQFTSPSEAGGSAADSDADSDAEEDNNTEKKNSIRESCFSGFESFVSRCPTEIAPHLPKIIEVCLAYMKFDPNYSYDSDSDAGEDDDDDDDDEDAFDDYSSDGNDTDDDDSSWKVRFSAVLALTAVIDACRTSPGLVWDAGVADELLGRFKEREESVRVAVVKAYTRLVRHSVACAAAGGAGSSAGGEDMDDVEMKDADESKFDDPKFLGDAVRRKGGAAVKACEKQLKVKKGNEKTKTAALSLLCVLCSAPGGLGDGSSLESVFAVVAGCLSPGAAKALKLDALAFLQVCLRCDCHPPSSVQPHINSVLPLVSAAVQEDWYKIIAAALRVLGSIPALLVTPADDDEMGDAPPPPPPNVDVKEIASQLYSAVSSRLDENDIDQEIKEASISAVGSVVSTLGNHLPPSSLNSTLQTLTDRMGNEITRSSALRTLGSIASSPLKVDMSSVLEPACLKMANFLRQHSRQLKMTVLEAISSFVQSNGGKMSDGLFVLILEETAPLITDADLQVSHLAISVSYDVLAASPSSVSTIKTATMPTLLRLVSSPLLQGLALSSTTKFLEELSLQGSGEVPFDKILSELQSAVQEEAKPQALSNLSKCIASVLAVADSGRRSGVVSDLLSDCAGPEGVTRRVGLLTIGALGERIDLSSVPGLGDALLGAFDSADDQTKSAASYALGHVSVRAMGTFLPVLVDALKSGNKVYLVLSSMKELIVSHLSLVLIVSDTDIGTILPLLVGFMADEDEGVRSMVAECVGCFVTMSPDAVIPTLKSLAEEKKQAKNDQDNLVLWTICSALRNALSSKSGASGELIASFPSFLACLDSEDFPVKTAALLMVNAAVHYVPHVILSSMKDVVMPALTEFLELKAVRTIDLGPFKHKIDDALPLRKASLAILDSALTQCPSHLDVGAILPRMSACFGDDDDVKIAAHQLAIKFAKTHPAVVAGCVGSYLEAGLQKTITKKVKDTATQQEREKNDELVRSALRVVVCFEVLETDRAFGEFIEREVMGRENVKAMYEALKE